MRIDHQHRGAPLSCISSTIICSQMGGTGMKGIASTLQWSLPAHTAHPRPSALCPNPRHATPLPSATPASPTFLLFGVPHLAIGLDQDMGQPTRRSSRDRATRIME